MTNEEYVKRIGLLYNKILSLRKDEDYIINQPQMDKFIAVCEFFMDAAAKLDGHVDPVILYPREERGDLTATFLVFDVHGENVAKFCDVMRACSAIGIDSTNNGEICIACTVPNVFVHK